ncbi:hypothetical protein GALMADRAFT_213034 [Galerina marginata CBS 339.88]|uniref:Uncharacterized protein n=1 Tax=Galerina marginata (strain CBS 339.88) TaxID=685588 RepID=A0A067SSS4_GALM3|nr:hypothetical protein GALMADRAFT_213034 [Galerina marginata CBS 339.88]
MLICSMRNTVTITNAIKNRRQTVRGCRDEAITTPLLPSPGEFGGPRSIQQARMYPEEKRHDFAITSTLRPILSSTVIKTRGLRKRQRQHLQRHGCECGCSGGCSDGRNSGPVAEAAAAAKVVVTAAAKTAAPAVKAVGRAVACIGREVHSVTTTSTLGANRLRLAPDARKTGGQRTAASKAPRRRPKEHL